MCKSGLCFFCGFDDVRAICRTDEKVSWVHHCELCGRWFYGDHAGQAKESDSPDVSRYLKIHTGE